MESTYIAPAISQMLQRIVDAFRPYSFNFCPVPCGVLGTVKKEASTDLYHALCGINANSQIYGEICERLLRLLVQTFVFSMAHAAHLDSTG